MSRVPPRPDLPGTSSGPAPPGRAPEPTVQPPIASVGRRFGGWIIDALIFAPVAFAVLATRWGPFMDLVRGIQASQGNLPRAELTHLIARLEPFGAIVGLLYFAYQFSMVAWRGQTIGKMAVRTKVVQVEDGVVPGVGRALVRAAIPSLAALIPTVGGLASILVRLWILLNPRRQGLHDLAARTIVVETPQRV